MHFKVTYASSIKFTKKFTNIGYNQEHLIFSLCCIKLYNSMFENVKLMLFCVQVNIQKKSYYFFKGFEYFVVLEFTFGYTNLS